MGAEKEMITGFINLFPTRCWLGIHCRHPTSRYKAPQNVREAIGLLGLRRVGGT